MGCWPRREEKSSSNRGLQIRQPKSLGEQWRLMRIAGLVALIVLPAVIARAESLLPTDDGTTWTYESVEELGGPTAAPPTSTPVIMRIGRQTFAGREFIQLETITDDVVTKTELMTLDERGWVCHFRAGK